MSLENPIPLIPQGSLPEDVREGNRLTQVHLEKTIN